MELREVQPYPHNGISHCVSWVIHQFFLGSKGAVDDLLITLGDVAHRLVQVKYDGFRAFAYLRRGTVELVSPSRDRSVW